VDVKTSVFSFGGGGGEDKLAIFGRKSGSTLIFSFSVFCVDCDEHWHFDIYIHNFGGGCLFGNVHLEDQEADGRLMLRYVFVVICCKKGTVWCHCH